MAREKPPINPDAEVRAPRRHAGGARREASERIVVRASSAEPNGFETHGWTLNVSRGGIRAIVEDPLVQGAEYQLLIGVGGGGGEGEDEAAVARRASVVWLQDEADGQIVGLKYLDVEEGSDPPKDG